MYTMYYIGYCTLEIHAQCIILYIPICFSPGHQTSKKTTELLCVNLAEGDSCDTSGGITRVTSSSGEALWMGGRNPTRSRRAGDCMMMTMMLVHHVFKNNEYTCIYKYILFDVFLSETSTNSGMVGRGHQFTI